MCEEIHNEKNKTEVFFRHDGAPPAPAAVVAALPDVGGIREFYGECESLLMYLDEKSGDAAYWLAPPSQWAGLDECFRPWLDGAEDWDDADDGFPPPWVKDCLVVGEIPASGNYLLVPTTGKDVGKVFEFEHDGCEFVELGDGLPDFVKRALYPDSARLTAMAAHLRFGVEGTEGTEGDGKAAAWWIRQMRDNRGNSVFTRT